MASDDEITKVQSFAERTLKYGRNLMAAAVTIGVFALVPVVDLAKSRPFNFKIEKGGEIWIWGILLTLLLYYGVRFFVLAIQDYREWRSWHGSVRAKMKTSLNNQINEETTYITDIENYRGALDNATAEDRPDRIQTQMQTSESRLIEQQNGIRSTRTEISIYNWRRTYFWIADAGLPTSLFVIALLASLFKIYALL